MLHPNVDIEFINQIRKLISLYGQTQNLIEKDTLIPDDIKQIKIAELNKHKAELLYLLEKSDSVNDKLIITPNPTGLFNWVFKNYKGLR